jgi:hypothetical protein
VKDQSLMYAIDLAQRAAAALLKSAPLQNTPETRALANTPGAHFVTSVSPDSIAIEIVAGEARARVFGYGAVANFEMGAGA